MELKYDKKYDDIINLPHHVSKKHPQMSMYARAAQFGAFEPLEGHKESLRETENEIQEEYEKK